VREPANSQCGCEQTEAELIGLLHNEIDIPSDRTMARRNSPSSTSGRKHETQQERGRPRVSLQECVADDGAAPHYDGRPRCWS